MALAMGLGRPPSAILIKILLLRPLLGFAVLSSGKVRIPNSLSQTKLGNFFMIILIFYPFKLCNATFISVFVSLYLCFG